MLSRGYTQMEASHIQKSQFSQIILNLNVAPQTTTDLLMEDGDGL